MADRARWIPLSYYRDKSVPKLHNLQVAASAGLPVPPTWWLPVEALEKEGPPAENPFPQGPLIVRSGSPNEDTDKTSNAGQLLSVMTKSPEELPGAVRRVAEVIATMDGEKRQGVVFVQPLVAASEAGVTFFDGFYWERTASRGNNVTLTAGTERGVVTRGTYRRGENWSMWLMRLWELFGKGHPAIDVEWAQVSGRFILLQARPALFPVKKNPILSLANHKEIMGDPPSPWMVSVLEAAGRDALAFFDPHLPEEGEQYAVVAAERAWMNFSAFYRLMDHWGLPRTWVTEGVGGETDNPRDTEFNPDRLFPSLPQLVALQGRSLLTVRRAEEYLRAIDQAIETSRDAHELWAANVEAMRYTLRMNFAINGLLSGASRLRRTLHIGGQGRVVTRDMMEEYAALGALPLEQRPAALDTWLGRYGHRGPLESDLIQPRFGEMRRTLLRDVASLPTPSSLPVSRGGRRSGPFFLLEERREWWRDQLMRRWQRLRERLLEVGSVLVAEGQLDAPEDIFFVPPTTGDDPLARRATLAEAKARHEAAKKMRLPLTATLEQIEAAAQRQTTTAEGKATPGNGVFSGIGLGAEAFEGQAVVADDLPSLLNAAAAAPDLLTPETVLVVAALEPSWAVVFPRVGAVVTEIGGELSHAAILLREARKPAVVNCAGILSGGAVSTGDRLGVDPGKGKVTVNRRRPSGPPAPP